MKHFATSLSTLRPAAHPNARQTLRYQDLAAHHALVNLQPEPTRARQPVPRPVHTSFRRSARLLIGCR